MKVFVLSIAFILLHLFPCRLSAQDTISVETDSVVTAVMTDFENTASDRVLQIDTVKPFKPDPARAVIYSALCPGLGQIYNKKYWKLPIVYGGFLGCVYAISWNGNQYSGYKGAYNDMTDSDPNTNSWEDYRPYSYDPDPSKWTDNQRSNFTNALKSKRDYYRRYRDLSCIITVGVYALCMIDAYVDAQLFDFDVSPELSMRIDPVIFEPTSKSSRALGLQCSFQF